MKLNKLTLTNVCQHRDTTVQFGYGVTGIFGPNGCGKSNLLKMAKVSLTGDYSVNPGVKQDNIRDGVADEPSRINAVWQHAGATFEIQRGLQQVGSYLQIIGGTGTRVTKQAEINSMVERIIGLPRQIIDGFIFVDQWKMFEFMSAKPADRANTFAHLCNTFVAEQLWKLLGAEEQAAGRVPYVDESELQRLQTEYDRVVAEANTTTQQMDETFAGMLSSRQIQEKQQLVEAYVLQKHQASRLIECRSELDAWRHNRTHAEDDIRQLTTDEAVVADRLASARTRLSGLQQLEKDYNAHCALASALQTHEAQLASLIRPVQPAEVKLKVSEDALRQQKAAAMHTLRDAERRLATFASENIVECPTCGTPVAELERLLDASQHAVDTLPAKLEKIEHALSVYTAYKAAMAEYTKQHARYAAAKAEHEREVAVIRSKLPHDWNDLFDRRAFNDVAAAVDRDADLLAQIRQNLAIRQAALHDADAQSAKLTSDIATIEKSIGSEISEADYATAKQAQQRHFASVASHQHLQAQRTSLNTRAAQISERFRVVDKLAKRNKHAQDWLADVSRWRSILHRDNLPKLVAQELLERLVVEINNNLEAFATPFTVKAADDLSLDVTKPRGRVEAASRLSGGEKILLAVAFRIAVNSVFASEAGMLVLDEPSAGLDTRNIDCLADVLERISLATTAKQQQILIVTHDERLGRAIPTSIYLPDVMA